MARLIDTKDIIVGEKGDWIREEKARSYDGSRLG